MPLRKSHRHEDVVSPFEFDSCTFLQLWLLRGKENTIGWMIDQRKLGRDEGNATLDRKGNGDAKEKGGYRLAFRRSSSVIEWMPKKSRKGARKEKGRGEEMGRQDKWVAKSRESQGTDVRGRATIKEGNGSIESNEVTCTEELSS